MKNLHPGLLDAAALTGTLAEAGCVAARAEAELLLEAADGEKDVLEDLVLRRVSGEPIAWLTGRAVFCDIDLVMHPGVYVPRWQSQELARRATALLPPGGMAVDLCTGSGAIAAVMGAGAPTARVVGTELDPLAARCARDNGVEVFEGFLDDPLPQKWRGRIDVWTAVAPYVPTDSLRFLARDVLAFEPRQALDGGKDGMGLLIEVARRSVRWLRPGGWLLLELGGGQAEALTGLLHELDFARVDEMIDEDGDLRGICARR